MNGFENKSFLKLVDFSIDELEYILNLSAELKTQNKQKQEKQYLKGKNIALIFEKTSTRTRCAFETASYQQGAQVTYLGPGSSQIGYKESVKDTARVLGRMYDGIEYRGFGQDIVEVLAKYAGVPVWNGLTNEYHPTQVMADFLTMTEHTTKSLREIKFCYMGDAHNNVANSLMAGAAIFGMDFRAAAPAGCHPSKEMQQLCMDIAVKSGASITISDNKEEALKDVDFIYTDVWLSMGEPEDKWQERIDQLLPYQVNKEAIRLTGNKDVKFLHCLPAFHNRETKVGEEIYKKYGLDAMEVTEEVFESDHSIVFDQAENRMHTIKAVMVATLVNI